jgi:hypothetical protein
MKAAETLIAWNDATDDTFAGAPPGSLAVGPLLHEDEPDWTESGKGRLYTNTGGAAWVDRQTMRGLIQRHHVVLDWYKLVYVSGLHPYVVHIAFLHIDEYLAAIKEMGCGPDRDELGHDPEVGHGRAVRYPVPKIKTHRIGRSIHVWPVETEG